MPRTRPRFTRHLTPIGAPMADDMTPEDFAAILKRLDLSQVAVARLMGVNDRTARRWANGFTPVPPPVARFLRYLARAKISPVTVMEILEAR